MELKSRKLPTAVLEQLSVLALDGMSVPDDYEFLKWFFPIDPDVKISTKL